ncbi:MAG: ABC transporter ATP-binding protein [Proteobacteria bacterium]|nr:ABC transporter ATP-binding protein [Pseudomonadota bacterium]
MVLEVKQLNKSYLQGDGTSLEVLRNIDMELGQNQTAAIMGESGSGKTTFLNCITGLDKFNSGKVKVCQKEISNLNDDGLSRLRNSNIGFVFQFHYLLKDFNVRENVMLPCLIAGVSYKEAARRSEYLLKEVKLKDRMNYSPSQLSGGEQQRVAIARAMVMVPDLLVMDEPTGNLDEQLTDDVITGIIDICKENGTSIVIATHNKRVADHMNKVYHLSRGHLERER